VKELKQNTQLENDSKGHYEKRKKKVKWVVGEKWRKKGCPRKREVSSDSQRKEIRARERS